MDHISWPDMLKASIASFIGIWVATVAYIFSSLTKRVAALEKNKANASQVQTLEECKADEKLVAQRYNEMVRRLDAQDKNSEARDLKLDQILERGDLLERIWDKVK